MAKNTLIAIVGSTLVAGSSFAGEIASAPLEPAPTPAPTPSESLFTYELAAGIHSNYVFRGVDQGGGRLVDVARDFGFAEVNVGVIYFNFPDDSSANTTEIYVGVSKSIYGVGLNATYYYDIDDHSTLDNAGQAYLDLSASYGIETLPFSPELTVGFAFQFGDEDPSTAPSDESFQNFYITLAGSHELNSYATISPYITYVVNRDRDSQLDNGGDDELFGGVSISVSF